MDIKKALLFLSFLAGCIFHAQTLHLYGGADHDQYLGCLNCDNFDKNSIWNKFSDYGNTFGSKSIWNTYGNYGSTYGAYSPWNAYASYPPAIVDQDGNFFGFLTLNPYQPERSELELAVILCRHHDEIRSDVDGWYRRLFR
ncbi:MULTISPECIES: hypothetical protein [Chryseobacterium]|uniref:Glycyl-tRNA synthetase subunit alpha n=1 Tax=Chryseobacterium candidae TaxID=1978493 RepID=A0ABY2R8I1_9FLAO|nr:MULTISPECIES: hypothetical protein [Chryseobacterium]PXW16327.1 hypothetical protein C8D70_104266 [Chryseobacterium sp. CBTAP 102]THV59811.1 hypothetical protein EK417_10185 [Chryseobacterium candidae]SIQ50729.1 hypothetical protein SAMN05880573_10655 [Chryseobacterium sp. RU33C]